MGVLGEGRFRRIIISGRTRSRSDEQRSSARLVPNVFGKASQGLLATPALTCSYGLARNNYPSEAGYWRISYTQRALAPWKSVAALNSKIPR